MKHVLDLTEIETSEPERVRWDYATVIAISIIIGMCALTFLQVKVLPKAFPVFEKAEAATVPMTEAEICANLERYSNGADYEAYCAGI